MDSQILDELILSWMASEVAKEGTKVDSAGACLLTENRFDGDKTIVHDRNLIVVAAHWHAIFFIHGACPWHLIWRDEAIYWFWFPNIKYRSLNTITGLRAHVRLPSLAELTNHTRLLRII